MSDKHVQQIKLNTTRTLPSWEFIIICDITHLEIAENVFFIEEKLSMNFSVGDGYFVSHMKEKKVIYICLQRVLQARILYVYLRSYFFGSHFFFLFFFFSR